LWTLAISRWCISSAFQAAEEVRVFMEVPFSQNQDVAPVPNVTTRSGSIVNMTRTSPVRIGVYVSRPVYFLAMLCMWSIAPSVVLWITRPRISIQKEGPSCHKDCGKIPSPHIACFLPIRSGVHAYIRPVIVAPHRVDLGTTIRQQRRQVGNDRIGQQAHMTCRNGNSHGCYASGSSWHQAFQRVG